MGEVKEKDDSVESTYNSEDVQISGTLNGKLDDSKKTVLMGQTYSLIALDKRDTLIPTQSYNKIRREIEKKKKQKNLSPLYDFFLGLGTTFLGAFLGSLTIVNSEQPKWLFFIFYCAFPSIGFILVTLGITLKVVNNKSEKDFIDFVKENLYTDRDFEEDRNND